MRLPAADALVDDDERRLYEHDVAEFHAQNERSHARLLYFERFNACVDALRRFAPSGPVADIGCAQGNLALHLAEQGYRVVALDLRLRFLHYLRQKWESGTLWTIAGNACQLPLRRQFAAAILVEVIEHMAFPEAAIREVVKILAPGGIICLTTPNGERFHTGLPVFSEVADRTRFVNRQFEPDADGHLFYFTREELTTLLRDAGLEVLDHRFFGTPWLTGRLMGRYATGFFPLSLLRRFDRLMLRFDPLARWLAEGHLVVARRPLQSR